MISKDYFGEGKNIEFKREIPKRHEKFLKDIIAFSNCTGGKIILGIEDNTNIVYGIGDRNPFKLSDDISNMVSDACKNEEEKNEIRDVTIEKLEDWGLLCKVGKDLYPTHAFMLMTDNRVRYAKIQCALFKGRTRDIFIDRKEYTGPIYSQIDDAYRFVLNYIKIGVEIDGVFRNDRYELPIDAIREMIANAVVHRSYLDDSTIQVSIYDNRIEVMSPGMLYGGMDLETAKHGKSRCRNAAIAEAFYYMHIIEAWGTGLPRIINQCKKYGLPEPEFEELGDGFKVTIFRKVSNASEKVSNASEKVSNASEKEVNIMFDQYIPLLEKENVTETFIFNIHQVFEQCGVDMPFGQKNVMQWLDCSKSKATNIMNAMKTAKIIEKVNGLGAGRYKFIEL